MSRGATMAAMETQVPLDEENFDRAVDRLTERDDDLAGVVERFGKPQFWSRDPGFATLVLIILEQQVSLASAKAAYSKLVDKVGVPTPEVFPRLDAATLRGMGFSRQKTRYCRVLAEEIHSGSLDLDSLRHKPDEQVRTELIKITGIGRWTADIYLLGALRRPDVWPVGDLALISALQHVTGLDHRPTGTEFEEAGERWRPRRSVAAQLLWHHYLGVKGLKV